MNMKRNLAKPGDRNGDKLQNVWFVAVRGASKTAGRPAGSAGGSY